MKKLFSIVSKLSAKRFAEIHSDWPKLLFGSKALERGHNKSTCVFPLYSNGRPIRFEASIKNVLVQFYKIRHYNSVT